MQRKNWVRKGIAFLLCLALLSGAVQIPETTVYAAEDASFTFTENGLTFKAADDTATTAAIQSGADFPGGDLPDSVTYEGKTYQVTEVLGGAFSGYSGSITKLPSGLTAVRWWAFKNCTGLNLTALPEGIVTVEQQAFYGCTGLALTELPEGITSIEASAFRGCTSLALTELPENLTSIGASAFSECTSLALTRLPEGITSIKQGTFLNCSGLALNSLPQGVTQIEKSAFSGCTNLALDSLPDTVTEIGEGAFYNCSSMTLSSLPEGVTELGNSVFWNCTKITISKLPAGLTKLGEYTFKNCSGLTSMTIPEGVTELPFEVFRDCINLVTVSLPDSLTTIGSQVFQGCSRLKITSLPPNVTQVGYQSFWKCTSIEYIALGDNISEFSGQCFAAPYPDLIVSENSTTKATLEAATRKQGDIVTTWSGTQEGLDGEASSYVNESLTVEGDLTLASGKKLVITANGTMTITGNLVVETGAQVIIDVGGTLIVNGTIVNNGTITNNGTIINNGTITNNGVISTSNGELSGTGNVTGNEPLTGKITVNSYTGHYDGKPHAAITEIIGTEEGDIISYSTNYEENLGNPENIIWSSECPMYTTVGDTKKSVTVKVERIKNGVQSVAAIVTATVVIVKSELEIVELPETSPVTEGDTLEKSQLTGGKVVIKGTDTEVTDGGFYWSSYERQRVLRLTDSGTTTYSVYFAPGDYMSMSSVTMQSALSVQVNECFHENTERERREGTPSTCIEKGATEGIYCKQCGRLLEGNEELPLAEHTWNDGVVTLEPTTESTGEKTYTCSVCGKTRTETLPKAESNAPGDNGGDGGNSGTEGDNGNSDGNQTSAETPVITENPADGTYGYQEEAVLRVEAAVSDGGTLSYQWYQNSTCSTRNAVAIGGAVSREYRASTGKLGVMYYFCKVTNTNPEAAGEKEASADPRIAEITVVKAANPITKVDEYKKAIGSKVTLKAAGKTTYKVKNKKIATVTKKGKVTFKKYGTTTITVKAKGNAYYKAATKKIKITVTPKKVSISKAASQKAKTMVVRWKQDKSVTGYQLSYSANSKFKGAKKVTVKGAKSNSKTVQKLKAGKKYYVRVRAYKRVGGKTIYGEWSKTKTVKIKK